MSEEGVRRSFRLKDKPAPEYAFRNFLKVAINTARTSTKPTSESSQNSKYIPPEILERDKKYEDLFSSVVANALTMEIPIFMEKAEVVKPKPSKREYKRSEGSEDSEDSQEEDLNLNSEIAAKKSKIEEIPIPTISVSEKNDVEIQVIPVKAMDYKCACGIGFENHFECHKHIYEEVREHGDNELSSDCTLCGCRWDEIRANHACPICCEFVLNLEAHLVSHYRTCTSISAVMECRFCVRQFKTVKEVVEHEQQKHFHKTYRNRALYNKCAECSKVYNNQDTLVSHYHEHLDINKLRIKVEELQEKVQAPKEECPFCRNSCISRKSFLGHILKKHYSACRSIAFRSTMTDLEVKKEINELTEKSEELEEAAMKEVKIEVKEEIDDDGYPSV